MPSAMPTPVAAAAAPPPPMATPTPVLTATAPPNPQHPPPDAAAAPLPAATAPPPPLAAAATPLPTATAPPPPLDAAATPLAAAAPPPRWPHAQLGELPRKAREATRTTCTNRFIRVLLSEQKRPSDSRHHPWRRPRSSGRNHFPPLLRWGELAFMR